MSEPNPPSRPSLWGRLAKAIFPAVQQKPDFGPKLDRPIGSAANQPLPRPPENPARRSPSQTPFKQDKRDAIYQGPEPFLSPGTPLEPRMPDGEMPRRFQMPPGYNIQITPRSTEAISFAQLRAMSEQTIVRAIIEHVKDSLKSHEWDIVPNDDRDKAESFTPEIKTLREFWEMPDRLHTWDEWLGELLEEVLSIDALAIFKRKTRGGDLYGLDIIDGSTIKVLSDAQGFEPNVPGVAAYQQFLYGVPYVNMTREQLYYLPRNRRAHKYYGFGPVEQMIVTVNQALRRELYSLAQLTDGNIPQGFIELPKEWKVEEIKAFEEWWNACLAGDPQNRSRVRFVPQGANYTKMQEGNDGDGLGIFSPFDEWIARIMCYVLGVSPMPFIKLTNRAVAQEMGDTESEGGVGSLKLFIERFVNRVIRYDFGIEHLVFNWVTDRSRMQEKRVNRNVAYVNAGIFQIDEVRAEEGKDPLGLEPGYPTPAGYQTFAAAAAKEKLDIQGQQIDNRNAKNPGDPDLKAKQDFQVNRDDFRASREDQRRQDDQAAAVSASRQTKAQKAWEKCRKDELEKWERFALARKGNVQKAVGFMPEYITEEEAREIRVELTRAGAEKSFDDDVKHIFQYRRSTVPPIRLAPASPRDAAHYSSDLKGALNAVFQREAAQMVRSKKAAAGIEEIKPL